MAQRGRGGSARDVIALPAILTAIACLLVACAGAGSAAASSSASVVLTGAVRDDIVIVAAPRITTPTPDPAAGINITRLPPPAGLRSTAFASDQSRLQRQAQATAKAQQQSAATAASSSKPQVSGRLASVSVRVGDSVSAGQVVARLDDGLLELGVRKAAADLARAHAGVDVIGARIDDLEDARETLLDARAKVRQGLAQIAKASKLLASGATQLAAGFAQASAQQAKLASAHGQLLVAIAAIEHQIEQLLLIPPAMRPPGLLTTLQGKLAAATAQLDGVQTGLAKLSVALQKLNAGKATLAAARVKLATGRAQALAGLSRIRQGLREIHKGIERLERARRTARKQVRVAETALRTARDRAALATIASPAAGIVVEAAQTGEVVMAGAPVVKVRRTGYSDVSAYVTVSQLGFVEPGARAEVTLDSLPTRFAGKVISVAPVYGFPPSPLPTSEVHLLRTVPVIVRVPDVDGVRLPPGTPVDLAFRTTSTSRP